MYTETHGAEVVYTEAYETVAALHCANHPAVETLLRCNRCGKPVCLKCVGLTDVGYRCKECLHTQRSVYFTATTLDYILAGALCFIMALVVTPVAAYLLGEVWMFGLMLGLMGGPVAGGALATAVRFVTHKRQGRHTAVVAVAAAGMAVLLMVGALFAVSGYVLFFHLPLAAFVFLALSTAYHYLR